MNKHPCEDLYRSYRVVDPDPRSASVAAEDLFTKTYLLPYLAGLKAEPVLEIGAGTGSTLRALHRAGYARVSGTDASVSQVERARSLGSEIELGDGLAVLAARQSASLGAVIVLDVLEHLTLQDLLGMMDLARDRLRPGGLLIARVPNGEGLFGGAILHGDVTHARAFTRRSLMQVFALRGLETVAVMPVRPIMHGLFSTMRAALWSLVEVLLKIASGAESGRFDALVTRNILAVARRPA